MIIWEFITFLAIIFIIFVASCVGAIIIMFWILLAEWASHIGNQLADILEQRRKEKKDKGSGN